MKQTYSSALILFIVIQCIPCEQATASTGAYEGIVTSVDGCEGGFDNGPHKKGQWRWYLNGWRYLYPGYHEITLRKREAGYATDKVVVTADHAFKPSGTGPAASSQESGGRKAHVGKDGMVVAEAENYASLDERGHGQNYAKGSSYKGFSGAGYVISPKGDNTNWGDGPEVRIRIKIDKAGRYYFWQRVGGSSNSGYLGIDTARVFALSEEGITKFSAKITAFDYTSYGRWGRQTKQGEMGPPVGVNNKSAPAILTKIGHLEHRVAKNDKGQAMMPGKAPGTFTATVERDGRWESENVTTSGKCVWVMDGKICPPNIAFRPGRRAVLGAYRNSSQPHRMFVSSFDDAVRGVIKSFDGTSIVVEGKDHKGKSFSKTVRVAGDASVMVDGLQAPVNHALVVGRTVAVHPARGKTIIAFTRGLPKRDGETSF